MACCYGCYGCCCPDASRKATRNNVRINSSFKFNGAYDALVASSSPAEMLLSNSAAEQLGLKQDEEDGAGAGDWEHGVLSSNGATLVVAPPFVVLCGILLGAAAAVTLVSL